MRYYNKITKNEVIEGIHSIDENCVSLADGNVFFQPLPEGKEIVYVDDIPTSLQDIVKSIDSLKSIKWNEVKSFRTNKYQQDIITPEGTWQVDSNSIDNINSGLLTLADNLDVISWLDASNNLVEVTKEQLNNILVEHANRKISIFNASLNIKDDIELCTSVEQIESLDIESLFNSYIV